jgi:hypothetical protein
LVTSVKYKSVAHRSLGRIRHHGGCPAKSRRRAPEITFSGLTVPKACRIFDGPLQTTHQTPEARQVSCNRYRTRSLSLLATLPQPCVHSIRRCRWGALSLSSFLSRNLGRPFWDVRMSGRPQVQPFSPSLWWVRYDVTAYLSRENRVSVSSVPTPHIHGKAVTTHLSSSKCASDSGLLPEGDCERDETIRTQEERRPEFWIRRPRNDVATVF